MKITFFSTRPYEVNYLNNSNRDRFELNFVEVPLTIDTCHLAEGSQAVSVFTSDDASAEVLKKLASMHIKYISTRSSGYDHIDLFTAGQLELKAGNVPDYSPYAIAEHTLALMLGLNRKLIKASRLIAKNDFRLNELIGFDLHDKTVGIIGTGRIGSKVARILHGFGCNILAYDPKPDRLLRRDYGVLYTDLSSLCHHSDIITLHCPLNQQTYHLIDRQHISLMKRSVMLINTSRGAVIDTNECLAALKDGRISYLGLDVYENEKDFFFQDHSVTDIEDNLFKELVAQENILITGHQAFLTDTALTNIADATFFNFTCWYNGMKCKNELHSIPDLVHETTIS